MNTSQKKLKWTSTEEIDPRCAWNPSELRKADIPPLFRPPRFAVGGFGSLRGPQWPLGPSLWFDLDLTCVFNYFLWQIYTAEQKFEIIKIFFKCLFWIHFKMQFNPVIAKPNLYKEQQQQISEGSCDTEAMMQTIHRNKLDFKNILK